MSVLLNQLKQSKVKNILIFIGLFSSITLLTSCVNNSEVIEDTSEASLLPKEKAFNIINTRISNYYNTEQRGDTIYFQDISSSGSNPNSALVIDSIVEYGSVGKQLVVMRVFEVSNKNPRFYYMHGFYSDTTKWQAITEMGSGQGYTVTLALASVSLNSNNPELNWIQLNCGDYGNYFSLPNWTLHEFEEESDFNNWGAFVLNNHTTLRGSGHQEITTIDLGGYNHLDITLRHSCRSEGISFSESDTDDIAIIEGELETQYGIGMSLEKHHKGNLDWWFSGQEMKIRERSSNNYICKVFIDSKRTIIDTTTQNPSKIYSYAQLFPEAGYTLSQDPYYEPHTHSVEFEDVDLKCKFYIESRDELNDLNVKKLIAIYPDIASTIQSIQEETKKSNEFLEREPDPFISEHPWFWRFEMRVSREGPQGYKPEVENYWSWGPIDGTATFHDGEILKSQ